MMRHTLRLCPRVRPGLTERVGWPVRLPVLCCRPAANGESVRGRVDRPGGRGSSYAYKQIHYLSNDARRSVGRSVGVRGRPGE